MTETDDEKKEQSISKLEEELKGLIVDGLVLEEVTPEDIDAKEPLFGEGVGLDSVDALELVMLLQKEYGINISNPSEETKENFESIHTLAKFVADERNQ